MDDAATNEGARNYIVILQTEQVDNRNDWTLFKKKLTNNAAL